MNIPDWFHDDYVYHINNLIFKLKSDEITFIDYKNSSKKSLSLKQLKYAIKKRRIKIL